MKLKIAILFVVVAAVSYSLATLAAEVAPADGEPYTVKWVGEMRVVHLQGDARPRVSLTDVAQGPGHFAIGPVAGLHGEITVIEGEIFVANAVDGQERVTQEWEQEAPFLVYGSVKEWAEVAPPEHAESISNIEKWLPEAARARGLDPGQPIPFKIETVSSTINYHIIANDSPGYFTARPHDELKHHFVLDGPATLVGVFSTEHAGIFTHHGDSTHIHVISQDKLHSGHVDSVQLGKDAKFFLPAR